MSGRGTARHARAVVALVATLTAVVAQMARLLFPIMFELGEDWDFGAAGLVAVGVFAAPVIALPSARLDRRIALVVGAVAAGGALVVTQVLDPVPAVAAVVLVAVALAGGSVVVSRLGDGASGERVVTAVILGLTLDTTLRAATLTWDLTWRTGATARIGGLLLAGTLVAVASTVGDETDAPGPGMRPVVFVAAGAFAALEILFLANLGFVSSQVDVALGTASAIVLAGFLVGVFLWAVTWRRPWPGRFVGALGLVAFALGWALPSVVGLPAAAIVIALQVVVATLLAVAARQPPEACPDPRRIVGATVGGSVLFLVITLLWQLHIDEPLPFPREVLPAAAALIVAIPALRFSGAPLRMSTGAEAWTAVVTVAALTIAVPGVLLATETESTDSPETTEGLSIVSYNVRGAVDVDGQLRPDRVAGEIRSSDPDVVVLQEVGRGWPIHGMLDLITYLRRELGMDAVFAPAADGQFGNAILSRLPMRELDIRLLPKEGSQERSYALVELETADGPIAVLGTHLQSRSTSQINALLKAVDGRTPVVVAGDMNVAPTDPEIELFLETGLVDVVGATGDPCRTTSAEPTSPCDRPDWIFVSPDLRIEDVRIGDTVASDHLAIHTRLHPN